VSPSYFHDTYGYLIILLLNLLERICLSWLKDRFGCSDDTFEKISLVEVKIDKLNTKIHKLQAMKSTKAAPISQQVIPEEIKEDSFLLGDKIEPKETFEESG